MHDLVVPHARARLRVERHDRLGEQVVAFPIAAIPVVRWRGHRQEQQTARGVKAHWRPYVGVPHILVRALFPGVPAELAGIRYGVKAPYPLTRSCVEGLHVTRRIVAIADPIAHAIADNHQVAVHHRRRRIRVLQLIHGATQIFGEIDFAVRAERRDRFARSGVERDELPPGIDENPSLSGRRPRGHTAMHEAGAVRRLARAPHFRIELPELAACARVECGDRRVWRGDVHRVADNNG